MSNLALHTRGAAILRRARFGRAAPARLAISLGCALAAAPVSAQTAPGERGFRTLDPPVITGAHAVSLEKGAIRLDIPDGMVAATPEEAARAYPNAAGPVYLYTAPDHPAHISLAPVSAPPMPLNKLRAMLESNMSAGTGDLRWITREVIDVGGRGWVHLEFVSRAPAGMLHQHLLVGPVRHGILMVELAALEEAYPGYRDAFLRTIQSVRLTQ